jgi:LVIVD repeat
LTTWVLGLDVSGNTCVVATEGSGLAIFDVRPATPLPLGSLRHALHLFNVLISGSLVYAACGKDGILVADISDPSNPKRKGLSPVGPSCYDVTGPVIGNSSFVSLGVNGMTLVDLTDPRNMVFGTINYLRPTPPLGADFDLDVLRTNMDNAADSRGKIKEELLYVHALLKAKQVDGTLDFETFEGIVVVIQGSPGRGQSSLYNQVSASRQKVQFRNKKSPIWLPGHSEARNRTTWGRKAHELGHWFGVPDVYEQRRNNGTILEGTAMSWNMAGKHDLGPLFSGKQADNMQLFTASNIERRRWSPTTRPHPEHFDIVAHGAA